MAVVKGVNSMPPHTSRIQGNDLLGALCPVTQSIYVLVLHDDGPYPLPTLYATKS